MMMRALLVLGGIGVLTAMELASPPRAGKAAVEPPLAQTAPEAAGSRDSLTSADRLEVARLLHAAPLAPVSPVETTPPLAPAAIDAQDISRSDTLKNIASKNLDPRNRASEAQAAVVLPRPRPRQTAPRLAAPKPAESRPAAPRPAEARPAEARHAALKPTKPERATGPDRSRPVAETGSCHANVVAALLNLINPSPGCET
jgi:hypothetical protein